MIPIRTTLTGTLAIAFAFVLIFGMNHDIFAQGYRKGADTCIARDDAPDDDGDGIPNGRDDDYVPPKDGTGRKYQKGNGKRAGQPNIEKGNRGRGNDDCVPARDGTGNKYGKGRANRSTVNASFRKSAGFRNGKHQHAAAMFTSSRHLRQSSRRTLTGTCNGTGRQIRRGRR